MKVSFPVCQWCHSPHAVYPCRGCGYNSCQECLVHLDQNYCEHQPRQPLRSTGWEGERYR